MEAQTALVGAESGVVLDAEAAVHVDVAQIVGPRDADISLVYLFGKCYIAMGEKERKMV